MVIEAPETTHNGPTVADCLACQEITFFIVGNHWAGPDFEAELETIHESDDNDD